MMKTPVIFKIFIAVFCASSALARLDVQPVLAYQPNQDAPTKKRPISFAGLRKLAVQPQPLRYEPDPEPQRFEPDPEPLRFEPDPEPQRFKPDPKPLRFEPDPEPQRFKPDPYTDSDREGQLAGLRKVGVQPAGYKSTMDTHPSPKKQAPGLSNLRQSDSQRQLWYIQSRPDTLARDGKDMNQLSKSVVELEDAVTGLGARKYEQALDDAVRQVARLDQIRY